MCSAAVHLFLFCACQRLTDSEILVPFYHDASLTVNNARGYQLNTDGSSK